ncbi:Rqt4p RNJ42_01856 [Nakaseomyces bracarensis]|uniref:Rqt4p n=1 Tax=Nakaseomyces bracarensis TaxID=273131 RepID=UPI0038727B1F
MTRKEAIEYAIKEIPSILPLEAEDIKTLCVQVLSSSSDSPDKIAESFMEILGHEELVFDFVIKFNELLKETATNNNQINTRNSTTEDEKISALSLTNDEQSSNQKKNISMTVTESDVATPKTTTNKNDQGRLISNYLDNASKSTKKNENSRKERTGPRKNKKIQSLEEIDDVVKLLEIEKENQDSNDYICNCQAKRHPLFELVPNCLSCGKIICVKEGLHLNNCSFCGVELIPVKERLEIMDYLNKERQEIQNKKDIVAPTIPKKKQNNTYKISTGMGKNMFDEHDKLMNFIERQQEREKKRKEVLQEQDSSSEVQSSNIEKNQELQDAQERLDRLLHFQETSTERTKIIDNASDFNMSGDIGVWGSAKERALLLKKQQRNLKKWEQLEKERNGRREKYVLNMNINTNGKVTMSEVVKDNIFKVDIEESVSDEDELREINAIKNLEQDIRKDRHSEVDNSLSNVWDYEKDMKKFTKPVYVPSNTGEETSVAEDENRNWKNRVQIPQDDDSLEQNILAVL